MDNITETIKHEIKTQYQSLRRFAEESGIPYSTLTNCLSKGINGTAYNTVAKICNLLSIKQDCDEKLVVYDDKFHDLYQKLTVLDDKGVHTIETILEVENERCQKERDQIKQFEGLGYSEGENEDKIRRMVRMILEEELHETIASAAAATTSSAE
ncbi:MAG: hypothetical protein IJ242_14065 [Clostridia bacterium]|nr:hypothetical protein [Clostridia bacterium]